MKSVKIQELVGFELDWAVAKCEGWDDWSNDLEAFTSKNDVSDWKALANWRPSTNWSQGGPIIEQQEIGIKRNTPCSKGREWEASPSITAKGAGGQFGYGPTPLISAMRCYVASKVGTHIEIPE